MKHLLLLLFLIFITCNVVKADDTRPDTYEIPNEIKILIQKLLKK